MGPFYLSDATDSSDRLRACLEIAYGVLEDDSRVIREVNSFRPKA